jgi:hypothetical protein
MTDLQVDNGQEAVGRVLRASTRGFDCGTHSRHIDERHDFGAFVKAPIGNDIQAWSIGLIYKVEIKDDQLISELVMGEGVPENILRDQRENRLVPVEVKVINVGYVIHDTLMHSLPPRPPMSLSDVLLCTPQEIYYFTQRCDFFRIIIGASEVPSDDLIAACVRNAAQWYADDGERYAFLVRCGRQLARDIGNDLKRLSYVLALIKP